jgi:hypothetical protein
VITISGMRRAQICLPAYHPSVEELCHCHLLPYPIRQKPVHNRTYFRT